MIYTEVSGTNFVAERLSARIVGFRYSLGVKVGAYAVIDISNVMLYLTLGKPSADGKHHEVTGWRAIDRDEFDEMTGLSEARRGMGWPK